MTQPHTHRTDSLAWKEFAGHTIIEYVEVERDDHALLMSCGYLLFVRGRSSGRVWSPVQFMTHLEAQRLDHAGHIAEIDRMKALDAFRQL